jgi:hypothetical protein
LRWQYTSDDPVDRHDIYFDGNQTLMTALKPVAGSP